MNLEDDDVPEKSEVQREHLKRVKAQMAAEEEALKASREVKGTDKKKYKKFSNKYVELELPDETKLKIARNYQALNIFMGFIGLCMIFLIIHDPKLHFSLFENFIIVFKFYNSTLFLHILEDYFVLEIHLILLGCILVATSIIGIIHFQHKHDKISDRINSGRSIRNRLKRAARKYHAVIIFMVLAGIGMIFLGIYYLGQELSLLENSIIVLEIYSSTLHLSILESFVIKMNLILLGFVLVVMGARKIEFGRKR